MTDPAEQPYAILCVCSGNVCRSPAAERLLATRLGPKISVTSAGTLGLVGRPIDPLMVAHLVALDLPDVGYTSRGLTAGDVREADLVLGMAREHRAAAVELVPAAVRRAFTLVEFARLLAKIEPEELPQPTVTERLRAAVPLAAARRQRAAGPIDADDVVDPYRLQQADYDRSFATIRNAVDTIAARLVPHSG